MKKIIAIIFVCSVLPILTACSDDDTTGSEQTQVEFSSTDNHVTANGNNAAVTLDPTGGTATIAVNSQLGWTIEKDPDDSWCNVSSDEKSITVTAAEFVSDYIRSTVLYVVANGRRTGTVTVSQAGTERATIAVSPEEVMFTERGGKVVIDVITQMDTYHIAGVDEISWLSVEYEQTYFTLIAEENNDTREKTATISVIAGTAHNTASEELSVTVQSKTPAFIIPEQTNVALPDTGGETMIRINTNRNGWSARSSAQWLRAEEGEEHLTLVSQNNTTGEILSATVTLTAGSGDDLATAQLRVQQFREALILEYTVNAGNLIVIPIAGDVNCYVDWGDGMSETVETYFDPFYDPNQTTHLYTDAGKYQVKIYGVVPSFTVTRMTDIAEVNSRLTRIVRWANLETTSMENAFQCAAIEVIPPGFEVLTTNVTNFYAAFANCKKLKEIPAGFMDGCQNAEELTAMFRDCTALETIHPGAFDDCVNVTSVASIFAGCTSLKTIPAGLFDGFVNVNNFISCFLDCRSLQQIPSGLFDKCLQGEDFFRAFEGCSSLVTIPGGLFKNNTKGRNFYCSSIFAYCTGLKTIPEDLFQGFVDVTDYNKMFEGCTSLQTVPEGLFAGRTKAESFSRAFAGCTGLVSIPENLFADCVQAYDFTSTFSKCSSLQTVPAGLFSAQSKARIFDFIFQECTGLTTIPQNLFDPCEDARSFAFAFAGCENLTSISGLFTQNRKITDFDGTFWACENLTGESPFVTLNQERVHLYDRKDYPAEFSEPMMHENCFSQCTGLDDYPQIPTGRDSWRSNTTYEEYKQLMGW